MAAKGLISNGNDKHDATEKETNKESNLQTQYLTDLSRLASVRSHVHVLYAVVFCLTIVLISSVVVCYLQIVSLREILSSHLIVDDIADYKFSERKKSSSDPEMPYSHHKYRFHLENVLEKAELITESDGRARAKRQSSYREGSESPGDWLWVNTFDRTPVSFRPWFHGVFVCTVITRSLVLWCI